MLRRSLTSKGEDLGVVASPPGGPQGSLPPAVMCPGVRKSCTESELGCDHEKTAMWGFGGQVKRARRFARWSLGYTGEPNKVYTF